MSTICYLSSVLDPQAGANAAKAAIEEYTKSSKAPKLDIEDEEKDLEKAAATAFTTGALKVFFLLSFIFIIRQVYVYCTD